MDSDCLVTEDLDHETLRAVLEIQLGDLDSIARSAKDKRRGRISTDAQVALQVYIHDLRRCSDEFANRETAQRIFDAVTREIPEILESCRQEIQIARDHNLARRMSSRSAQSVVKNGSKKVKRVRFVEAASTIPEAECVGHTRSPSAPTMVSSSMVAAVDEPSSMVHPNTQPSMAIVAPLTADTPAVTLKHSTDPRQRSSSHHALIPSSWMNASLASNESNAKSMATSVQAALRNTQGRALAAADTRAMVKPAESSVENPTSCKVALREKDPSSDIAMMHLSRCSSRTSVTAAPASSPTAPVSESWHSSIWKSVYNVNKPAVFAADFLESWWRALSKPADSLNIVPTPKANTSSYGSTLPPEG